MDERPNLIHGIFLRCNGIAAPMKFCIVCGLYYLCIVQRKIIHIDMDAFFASVEQRDDPTLRGKAIAVGYDGPRGVVATASYEARRYGVHSAMAMSKAKRLCPHLIVVGGHYARYKEVSHQVRDIFADYTDLIEPLSLDEAYLDVTVNKKDIPLAVDIAKEIRQRIREELHLTASAGVSYNKFLAKIASDYRKPDGLCVIHPDRASDFIARLRIEQFWGVGPKTAERLHHIGVFTGAELRQLSEHHLQELFGKMGPILYQFARGIDHRPVVTEWQRKSVGCEHTFATDLTDPSAIATEIRRTVDELLGRQRKADFEGRTLTLKVKYADFTQITRSMSADHALTTKEQILPLAEELSRGINEGQKAIRLLGLTLSNPITTIAEPTGARWVEQWLPFEDT